MRVGSPEIIERVSLQSLEIAGLCRRLRRRRDGLRVVEAGRRRRRHVGGHRGPGGEVVLEGPGQEGLQLQL